MWLRVAFHKRLPLEKHLSMKFISVFTLLLSIVFISCDRPLPSLANVDQERWKNDKSGCKGDRAAMLQPLKEQKAKLQGLSEMQIVKLLGKPDQNELYKRNQKFFFYWISGPKCSTDSLRLGIRFTAMGFAKEISFE